MTARQGAPTVRVHAPGRLAVFLRVGAVRPGGGHEVAGAYQAVSLRDEVHAAADDEFLVSFVGGDVPVVDAPTDEGNLALQAARLLARRLGHSGGVRLEIVKNLPVGGGLGGAAADAAAALVACDALWEAGLGRDQLMELAGELGADRYGADRFDTDDDALASVDPGTARMRAAVRFALAGGTAVGTGREAVLSPALSQGRFHWVLVVREPGMESAEVYRELDRHRERHRRELPPAASAPEVEAGVLQALRAGEPAMLAEVLQNDLQAPALMMAPELADVIELGERNGALAGVIGGTGPTVAFLAEDRDAAIALQIALSAGRHRALHVTGPVHGARIVLAE